MRRAPGPIDAQIGRAIRRQRLRRGMSVSALAAALGAPTALVVRYEAGESRVGAATLYQLTLILRCEISALFPERSARTRTPADSA